MQRTPLDSHVHVQSLPSQAPISSPYITYTGFTYPQTQRRIAEMAAEIESTKDTYSAEKDEIKAKTDEEIAALFLKIEMRDKEIEELKTKCEELRDELDRCEKAILLHLLNELHFHQRELILHIFERLLKYGVYGMFRCFYATVMKRMLCKPCTCMHIQARTHTDTHMHTRNLLERI